MEIKKTTFEEHQLKCIEYILVSTWKIDFHLITNKGNANSILELIDRDKLSAINTLIVKRDMIPAKFPEKYISAIQECKHELSNKKSREKYNVRLSEMRKIKSELIEEKRHLLEEISQSHQLLESADLNANMPSSYNI